MGKVITEIRDRGVGCIVMRDPAGRNVFDEALRDAIATELKAMFSDARVRAIVLGTEGGNFSVGGDVSQIEGHVAGRDGHRLMTAASELALLAGASPKPLVAAVHGYCLGAAAGLALLCDTIVMGRSATIGFPFLKIGLVPDFGISYTLPRRIGSAPARQALLNARNFAAEKAAAIGLADLTVDDEEVWPQAIDNARRLAEAPAGALNQVRAMLRDEPAGLAAALGAEALNQSICFGSAEVREGIAAFKEKRRPDFIGTGPA